MTSNNNVGVPNWNNRTIFRGDNLEFLRAMNSSSVDLIATDPPFNKGKGFDSTPGSLADDHGGSFQDRWKWTSEHDTWMEMIKNDHPKLCSAIDLMKISHSEDMGAFCCFLAVRLFEMHRILKPSGSIYIHCDQTANSYIRMVMDTIFGPKNFRNEIVWKYDGPQGPSQKSFAKKHDTILWYSKNAKTTFDTFHNVSVPQYEMRKMKRMPDGRYYYTIPAGNYSDARRAELEADGFIEYTRTGKPRQRRFLKDVDGVPMKYTQIQSVWNDIPSLGTTSQVAENTGYPTQKPIALYERIIKASCPDDGIVLDPFCGCATTCVAAEALGRQWVGMDLWPEVGNVIYKRMRKNEHNRHAKKIGMGDLVTPMTIITPKAPERTDLGEVGSPYLRPKIKRMELEPQDRFKNDKERKTQLLSETGMICQGCGREFDHPSYLELDHDKPRADGGWNHIGNRTLLCRPCNGNKSHLKTLSLLRLDNRKDGFTVKPFSERKPKSGEVYVASGVGMIVDDDIPLLDCLGR